MRIWSQSHPSLHSNMFLLIRGWLCDRLICIHSLHSNMFLLIRRGRFRLRFSSSIFTFQYVSINTCLRCFRCFWNNPLHSNMFLLILSGCSVSGSVFSSFTFQYVSIHTIVSRGYYSRYNHLYIPICFY